MLKKSLLLLAVASLVTSASISAQQAQTDEEFLAQTFLKDIDKVQGSIYLVIDTGPTYAYDRDELRESLCQRFTLCDTTLVNELFMYNVENAATAYADWNKDAPALVNPKFNNLIFIKEGAEAHKHLTQKKPVWYISKPIYSKDRTYALISTTYYTCHKLKGRNNYQIDVAGYNLLFKKTDGVWQEVGKYLTIIS